MYRGRCHPARLASTLELIMTSSNLLAFVRFIMTSDSMRYVISSAAREPGPIIHACAHWTSSNLGRETEENLDREIQAIELRNTIDDSLKVVRFYYTVVTTNVSIKKTLAYTINHETQSILCTLSNRNRNTINIPIVQRLHLIVALLKTSVKNKVVSV